LSSIRKCLFICKGWSKIILSDIFWYSVCLKRGIHGTLTINEEDYKKWREQEIERFKGFTSLQSIDPELFNIPKSTERANSWKDIFFLNLCPHFPSDLKYLKEKWNFSWKKQAVNSTCNMCNVIEIWVCIDRNCNFVGCGRSKNKHSLKHFEQYKHPLSIHLRELDVWCYKCDRFLGESNYSKEEQKLTDDIRKELLSRDLLYSHTRTLFDHL